MPNSENSLCRLEAGDRLFEPISYHAIVECLTILAPTVANEAKSMLLTRVAQT